MVCGGDFNLDKNQSAVEISTTLIYKVRTTSYEHEQRTNNARGSVRELRARERTRTTRRAPRRLQIQAPRAPLSGAVIGSQRHSFRKAKRNGERRRRAGFLELLIFVASLRRKPFFALSVVLSI